ncbi:hypothetical protein [Fodinicola acaciae]|uniref:hypothetical protein n=1 Tax=Fodinicola acaciae TaxID=2681555 RepID=UPI0013D04EF5|nr:hypothetical protein [Fodinicola acaciae]
MTRTRAESAAFHTADNVVRGVTVAAVLMSADVHLALYFAGFAGIPAVGPLFVVNAVAGLVIGVAMLVWRHWLPAFIAFGFNAVSLVALYVSTTVGLFGFRETGAGSQETISVVAEVIGLVGALALLVLRWQRARALVRA